MRETRTTPREGRTVRKLENISHKEMMDLYTKAGDVGAMFHGYSVLDGYHVYTDMSDKEMGIVEEQAGDQKCTRCDNPRAGGWAMCLDCAAKWLNEEFHKRIDEDNRRYSRAKTLIDRYIDAEEYNCTDCVIRFMQSGTEFITMPYCPNCGSDTYVEKQKL